MRTKTRLPPGGLLASSGQSSHNADRALPAVSCSSAGLGPRTLICYSAVCGAEFPGGSEPQRLWQRQTSQRHRVLPTPLSHGAGNPFKEESTGTEIRETCKSSRSISHETARAISVSLSPRKSLSEGSHTHVHQPTHNFLNRH